VAARRVGSNLFQPSGKIGSSSVDFLPDKSGVPFYQSTPLPYESSVPMATGTPHSCGSLLARRIYPAALEEVPAVRSEGRRSYSSRKRALPHSHCLGSHTKPAFTGLFSV
jgi:hypothetical protein